MKFAIRDDDTCYTTSPEILADVFGDIWDWVPVTLACVPFVGPESDVVYDTTGLVAETSIGDNDELVGFLRHGVAAERVEIALHGYRHDQSKGKPEFVAGSDLSEKVADGRRCLERMFGQEVSVFVPPHGRLSRAGVRAVESQNLDIAREYGPRPREVQLRLGWVGGFGRFVRHHLTAGREYRHPTPIDFGGHRSLFCYRLNRHTAMDAYRRAFDFSAENDGVFCLSVHAGRLDGTGRRKLNDAVRYAREWGARPAMLGEVLSGRSGD